MKHDLMLFQRDSGEGSPEHKRLNCVSDYCLSVVEKLEVKHSSLLV